jgi:hypothetical protein
MVILEKNDSSVSLLAKNPVGRPDGITKGAKPFLKSENCRTFHSGMQTAIVWRLHLQLSHHCACFDPYRNDTPMPASAKYTP